MTKTTGIPGAIHDFPNHAFRTTRFQGTAQSFSTTLHVMDVRADNHGRPLPKARFPAAPGDGEKLLTFGHPGVGVRNVRKRFGPKSSCLCCSSSLKFLRKKKNLASRKRKTTPLTKLGKKTPNKRSEGKTKPAFALIRKVNSTWRGSSTGGHKRS